MNLHSFIKCLLREIFSSIAVTDVQTFSLVDSQLAVFCFFRPDSRKKSQNNNNNFKKMYKYSFAETAAK